MNATRAECLPRTSATETNGDTCDVKLLAQMGYKQELRRQYSTLQVFAVAFSIMESVPSIASTLAFRFLRVRSAWFGRVHKGWFSASIFILLVGLAMADLASAMPTAGGLYWGTHYFAGNRWKRPLSFLIGYSNTLGLIGGMCSVDYTLAPMVLSCVLMSRDDGWTASRGVVYAVYVGLILLHGRLPRQHPLQGLSCTKRYVFTPMPYQAALYPISRWS